MKSLLSPRQTEVLDLIWAGKSNTDIGFILGITPCTVKNHVSSVLRKLGASCRVCAVRKAIKEGLIAPELPHPQEREPERPPVFLVPVRDEEPVAVDKQGIKVWESGEVEVMGVKSLLGPIERKLVAFLFGHAGRIHTRERILNAVWGDAAIEDRVVDVHMYRIKKLLAATKWRVESVRGIGYRLV